MDEESEKEAVAAFQHGASCLASGDAESALIQFMIAAEKLPGWAEAWLQLGICLHRLHRYQQACAAMRRGLEISNWEEPPAVLTYMDTLREIGNLREILAAAKRVPLGPFHHFSALLAGSAMQACEGASAAKPFYDEACACDSGNLLYCYLQAQATGGSECRDACVSLLAKLTSEDDELLAQLHRAQHHLDAPTLQYLNDKVQLHHLLALRTPRASFWPESFVLPAESDLAKVAEGSRRTDSPMWVLKERVSMGGLGVSVHDCVDDAMKMIRDVSTSQHEDYLLQAYVHPSVLLSGHKFSLRVFLVVYLGAPSGNPVFYLAHEGLLLRAPKPYTTEVAEKHAHITNQSAAQTVAPSEDLTMDLRDVVESELVGWSAGVEGIWASVEQAVVGLLPAAQSVLKDSFVDFQPSLAVMVPKVLGLDVLLSADSSGSLGTAWLLEVNRHPSLGEKYFCARQVKRTVLLDSWRLLLHVQTQSCNNSEGESTPNWPESYGCMGRMCME